MGKWLSEKQYVKRVIAEGSTVCPAGCGADESDLSFGSLDVQCPYVIQPVTCSKCGAAWQDVYTLAGYVKREG